MKFLRSFLAALLALTVFTIGGFMFLSIIIAALDQEDKVDVKDNSVLIINLNKPLADRELDDPLSNLSFAGSNLNRLGVIDIRQALNHAKTDEKIKGVVLYAASLKGGFALGEEVRQALSDFKSSGKFIVSYADLLTEGGYYISSVADELYVSPEGEVEWNGLAVEMSFFKGTFEKLDIKPQIFRVGDYKSAVEPFMLDKMSEANRRQVRSFINSIYGTVVAEVAEDIAPDADELKQISDQLRVRNVNDAVELKLITGIKYKDEFLEVIAEKIGEDEIEDIESVTYQDYNRSYSRYKSSKNKIAVIIGEGNIVRGEGEKNTIGSARFTKEIAKARNDDNIKAIVLRINSPGGDALASDLIWREVVKARESKPVIASFSNLAASGGYYIGMAADTIVAQPNTITGSIGIFAIVFNIGDFMANKLGITTDYENTGEYSGMWTSSRALTEAEKKIIQKSVNEGYEAFTSKAASGRNMSIDELKSLASGRVWTGVQARENGLVDVLGGLQTAIDLAAAKAGVADDYKVRYYPVQKTLLEELVEELGGSMEARMARQQLGDMYPYLDIVKKMKQLQGTQAIMPFDLTIR
jgi:protease-4